MVSKVVASHHKADAQTNSDAPTALRVGVIGAVHRLENPGKILLELIEVQTGSYLGEDDIIRIEDDYRRS